MWLKLTLLLEIVFWVIGLWFIITQIIMPALRRTPFFPILRRAPRDAERKLAAAHEAAQVSDIMKAADEAAPKAPPTSTRGNKR